jgi:hypothetical protein
MKKKQGLRSLFLIALLAMAVSAFTCTKQVAPPACQDVPGPSLLEQYIPDLKLTDTLFKLSVLEVGRLDKVRQKDVAKILDEAEGLVATGTTYDGLVMYLLPKFKWLREQGGAEIVVIGEYFTSLEGIKTPIEARDVCYIKHHIDGQRKNVLPWIKRSM